MNDTFICDNYPLVIPTIIPKPNYIGYIYITCNRINSRKYIGKHVLKYSYEVYEATQHGHCIDTTYLGSGKILKAAFKKYGIQNFVQFIIDYAYTIDELDNKEKEWIEKLNAAANSVFYNIHKGGKGGDTMSYNPTKYIIAKSTGEKLKGRIPWNKGKENCYSEESIKRMQLGQLNSPNKGHNKGHIPWNKGKTNVYSKETLRKMSESQKGEKNHAFGKPSSFKGRKHTAEAKAKQSYAHSHILDSTRVKMRKAKKGKCWRIIDGKRKWFDKSENK